MTFVTWKRQPTWYSGWVDISWYQSTLSWHWIALRRRPADGGCWHWHWDTMYNCYNCPMVRGNFAISHYLFKKRNCHRRRSLLPWPAPSLVELGQNDSLTTVTLELRRGFILPAHSHWHGSSQAAIPQSANHRDSESARDWLVTRKLCPRWGWWLVTVSGWTLQAAFSPRPAGLAPSLFPGPWTWRRFDGYLGRTAGAGY